MFERFRKSLTYGRKIMTAPSEGMFESLFDELVLACDEATSRGQPFSLPADKLAQLAPEDRSRLEQICQLFENVRMPSSSVISSSGDRANGTRPSTPAIVLPYRLGDYELCDVLGEGGMGAVYKAKQLSLDRPVAVKMIRGAALSTVRQRDRFREEALILAKLKHPQIVQIYEVGEHQGLPYFSMQMVEGTSLDKHVAYFLSKPRAAVELLVRVARTVHSAHQHGVLHRDLKPSNVLLDDEFKPYLTDFGLAKRTGDATPLTPDSTVLGTIGYVAPELLDGSSQPASAASDVYSLGTMLYELLVGHPPFHGESIWAAGARTLAEDPKRPRSLKPELARDLEAICLKCLEKAPEKRYASAEALADDLERFWAGEPTQARPLGTVGHFWKWCRRKPALASLSGALAATLTILGVGGYVSADRQSALRLEAQTQRDRAESLVLVSLDTADLVESTIAGGNPAVSEEELPVGVRKALATQFAPLLDRAIDLGVEADAAAAIEAKARIARAKLGRLCGDNHNKLLEDCERAATLYTDLVLKDPENIEYWRGRAVALNDKGVILGMMGRESECADALGEARALWTEILQRSPQNSNDRYRFALCVNNLGNVHKGRDHRAADAEYAQAINALRELHNEEPAHMAYGEWLVKALGNRGLLNVETKDSAAAESNLREARNVAESVVKRHPASRRLKEALFAVLTNLAELFKGQRQYEQAVAVLDDAIKLYEPLVRDYPQELEFPWGRALAQLSTGVVQKEAGRFSEARSSLIEALRLYQPLVKEHRDVRQIAFEAAEAQGALAEVERRLKERGAGAQ
jgi:serine/threonine protein kinase